MSNETMIQERIQALNEQPRYAAGVAAGNKKVYTVPEIQDILDIGRASAYRLVRAGNFKTIQIGGSIRVIKDSFDEWLDGQIDAGEKEEG